MVILVQHFDPPSGAIQKQKVWPFILSFLRITVQTPLSPSDIISAECMILCKVLLKNRNSFLNISIYFLIS
jgi:hypothetical protein